MLAEINAPHWVIYVASLAPTLGFLVGGIAVLAYFQRKQADNRAEWWRRVQYGFDQMLSDDIGRMNAGMVLVGELAESKLATPEDKLLMSRVVGAMIDAIVQRSVAEPPTKDKKVVRRLRWPRTRKG